MSNGPIKICSKCKKEKPADTNYFHKANDQKSGLSCSCKECKNKFARLNFSKWKRKKYRQLPRTKLKTREYNLKFAYDLTLEQYDQMFEQQGGVCKICGGVNSNGRRLVVDHDHKTNEIRGLLCYRCNFCLELLDNKTFIERAKNYLEGY